MEMKCWRNWPLWPSVMLTLVPFNPRLQWACTAVAAWYPSYILHHCTEMKCTMLRPCTSNMTDGCWWIEWTDALGVTLQAFVWWCTCSLVIKHPNGDTWCKTLVDNFSLTYNYSMEWMTGSPSETSVWEMSYLLNMQHSHVSSHSLDLNSIPVKYNAGTAICITFTLHFTCIQILHRFSS